MELPLYDITTGTGDFIANGVVSHNCFARPTHEYLDLDAGRDFEKEIVVKVNVPEVLRKELARPSWKREHIAMGTNTDPYQWVEGRYKLMRGIWEALRDAANPCSILTKSPLLLRDLDLMREVAARTEISACLSVPTLDEKAWRASEPHTPHPRARLEAVGELNRAGIPTGILIAPLMPGHQRRARADRADHRARDGGRRGLDRRQTLFLRGSVRGIFFDWLRSYRPDLVPRYERLYARGAYVPDRDRRAIERAAGLHKARPRGDPGRFKHRGGEHATAAPAAAGEEVRQERSSEPSGSCGVRCGAIRDESCRACARNHRSSHHSAARARALTVQAAQKAARARIELAIVIPLIALVLLANEYRQEVFGLDLPVRIFTATALLILGWRLARDVGRSLAPRCSSAWIRRRPGPSAF